MIFFTDTGKKKKVVRSYKYLIDWDCPSRSIFQTEVKKVLRSEWEADIVFEEFPMVGTRMTFDFFNASKGIIVEVDGKQHDQFVKHFHNNNRQNFFKQVKRDVAKENFCEDNNLILIRIQEGEDPKNIINLIHECE